MNFGETPFGSFELAPGSVSALSGRLQGGGHSVEWSSGFGLNASVSAVGMSLPPMPRPSTTSSTMLTTSSLQTTLGWSATPAYTCHKT
ncbi:hypothetical protein NQZ68_032715 [Dissostichus eleginoides]|nr:hypothetical protein NQZ68_032715 [Dissostichus eleginoides]